MGNGHGTRKPCQGIKPSVFTGTRRGFQCFRFVRPWWGTGVSAAETHQVRTKARKNDNRSAVKRGGNAGVKEPIVAWAGLQGGWSQLFTWAYFLFFLIVPICALIVKAFSPFQSGGGVTSGEGNRFVDFVTIATQPIALSAYSVTFSMALVASIFNAFFGFILAWVLVRYSFPFKRFLDAAIDLPFAIPTSVAGLTLATVYSPQGWIGERLQKLGIQVVYTRLGIATAMVFVSLPFVVRSLQPVLQEIDEQIEEAALSLGASPWTTFLRVLFPPLVPAFLTGVTLGFSRAIGEYGSLVLVSSNIPYKDLIASVLVFQSLESYSLGEATVIATVVLMVSFSILLGVSSLQSWTRNKHV